MTHTHRKINIEPKNLPYVLKKTPIEKNHFPATSPCKLWSFNKKNIQGLIFSWTTLNFRGASRNHHLDTMLQVVSPQQQAVYFLSRCGFSSCLIFSTLHFSLFFFIRKKHTTETASIYIYMIPVRGSLPPPPLPPPWYGPKTCVLQHSAWNVVFAVFLARWVAGAVRKPANS